MLAFALRAAVLGWGIVYLDPHAPLPDVVTTTDRRGARAVALLPIFTGTRVRSRALLKALPAWQRGRAGSYR